MGFDVKHVPCADVTRYIGFEFSASPPRWIPAGSCVAALDAVLRLLAKQQWIRLSVFRIALGQFVSLALLWRPALSLPHSCYIFTQL